MKSIEILLVEDNIGDIRLTQEAFKEIKINNVLHVVRDGEEAMKFLNHEGNYEDSPRPDLVLLDLNLPKKDGREVLAEIKSDPVLHRIPVVVLTTSDAETDIVKSYDLHANSYITKPVGLKAFVAVIKALEDFWFRTVKLPPDE